MSFVKKAREENAQVYKHGLIFTAGVLITFWALAGTLIVLRLAGKSIGWGFQLQSPVFLIILIDVLFILSLSLFGIFEVGANLMGIGSKASARSGYSGSFFTGIIAVIVATPCTAPFMGAAMGFAFTQPPWISIMIFTALGLGLASPYIFLSFFPNCLRFIPKPGAWMESFKQLMGFPLLTTVVWLLWVLGNISGNNAVATVLFSLVIISMGVWIMGRWGTPVQKPSIRTLSKLTGICFIAGSLLIALQGTKIRPDQKNDTASTNPENSLWIPFSQNKLSELRQAGKPVFIDFTADWCLTCKVNENIALTNNVLDTFRKKGYTLMKADFTSRNEAVANALTSYGRSGVPLYVLYSGGVNSEPHLLPQILTENIVLEAIE